MRDLVLAVNAGFSSNHLVEQHIVVRMLEGALPGRIYKAPHTVVRCFCPTVCRRGCQSLARPPNQARTGGTHLDHQRWLCSLILVPCSTAGISNSEYRKSSTSVCPSFYPHGVFLLDRNHHEKALSRALVDLGVRSGPLDP